MLSGQDATAREIRTSFGSSGNQRLTDDWFNLSQRTTLRLLSGPCLLRRLSLVGYICSSASAATATGVAADALLHMYPCYWHAQITRLACTWQTVDSYCYWQHKCTKQHFIHLLTATCNDWHIENSKNHKKVISVTTTSSNCQCAVAVSYTHLTLPTKRIV